MESNSRKGVLMNITRNAVYNFIHDAVKTAMPTVYVTSVYEPLTAQLPAVILRETDDFRNRENMTFTGVQGVRTSMFEAQVVSSRTNGSLSEAYDILEVVKQAFFNLVYNETNVVIMEDGSTGRYRLRATYRRVIGDADTLPTT